MCVWTKGCRQPQIAVEGLRLLQKALDSCKQAWLAAKGLGGPWRSLEGPFTPFHHFHLISLHTLFTFSPSCLFASHPCALLPLHSFSLLPFYSPTLLLFYPSLSYPEPFHNLPLSPSFPISHFALSPFTLTPSWPYSLLPLCHFVHSPLCSLTSHSFTLLYPLPYAHSPSCTFTFPSYPFIPSPSCPFILVPFHPCVLSPFCTLTSPCALSNNTA